MSPTLIWAPREHFATSFSLKKKKKKKIGKNNQTNSRVSKMALSYNLKEKSSLLHCKKKNKKTNQKKPNNQNNKEENKQTNKKPWHRFRRKFAVFPKVYKIFLTILPQ